MFSSHAGKEKRVLINIPSVCNRINYPYCHQPPVLWRCVYRALVFLDATLVWYANT